MIYRILSGAVLQLELIGRLEDAPLHGKDHKLLTAWSQYESFKSSDLGNIFYANSNGCELRVGKTGTLVLCSSYSL